MAFWFIDPIGGNQLVACGSPGMLPLLRSNEFTHGRSLRLWQLRGRNWEAKDDWKDISRNSLYFFSFSWQKSFCKAIKSGGFSQMACEITIPSCGCERNDLPLLALTWVWGDVSNVKSLSPWKDEPEHDINLWGMKDHYHQCQQLLKIRNIV